MHMKNVISVIALTLLTMASAHAKVQTKTDTIKGEVANDLMRALVASGFEIKESGTENNYFKGKLSVKTGAIDCEYNSRGELDDWTMYDTYCRSGEKSLENSFSLIGALAAAGAYEASDMGHSVVTMNKVACELRFNSENIHDTSVTCKVNYDVIP